MGGSNFISSYLLWNLENKINSNLPEKVTGIILLGGSFDNSNKAFEKKDEIEKNIKTIAEKDRDKLDQKFSKPKKKLN